MNEKLILGTVQFGLVYGINNSAGKPSSKKIKEILDSAFENNIKLLDTAEAYGNSQERIGEYHRNSKNKFEIITKFSSTQTQLSSNISQRIHDNLKTLGVQTLYGYMFHSFEEYQNYFSKFEDELDELNQQGLIKKIGVSLYTNEEFEEVLKNPKITLVQLPFNLLDNSSFRGDILEKAKKQGVEIHTRSVFLQGLFFRNPNELEGNLNLLKEDLRKIHELCSVEYAVNDLALNYTLSQSTIDQVLIGVDTQEQLLENISSANKGIISNTVKKINNMRVEHSELLNPSNWQL